MRLTLQNHFVTDPIPGKLYRLNTHYPHRNDFTYIPARKSNSWEVSDKSIEIPPHSIVLFLEKSEENVKDLIKDTTEGAFPNHFMKVIWGESVICVLGFLNEIDSEEKSG